MCRAVRRTLRDRTAVLLSGGIDSPAVAAYAGTPHPHVVGAISAVYPQHPTVDERGLIEMLAGKYGLELQTFTPGPLKLDRLAEWVRTFDGPWSAWLPRRPTALDGCLRQAASPLRRSCPTPVVGCRPVGILPEPPSGG